jgi:hypothetical protein
LLVAKVTFSMGLPAHPHCPKRFLREYIVSRSVTAVAVQGDFEQQDEFRPDKFNSSSVSALDRTSAINAAPFDPIALLRRLSFLIVQALPPAHVENSLPRLTEKTKRARVTWALKNFSESLGTVRLATQSGKTSLRWRHECQSCTRVTLHTFIWLFARLMHFIVSFFFNAFAIFTASLSPAFGPHS